MLALVFRSMIRSRVVCYVATLLAILWVLFIFHRFYNVDPFRQKLMYGALAGLAAVVRLNEGLHYHELARIDSLFQRF